LGVRPCVPRLFVVKVAVAKLVSVCLSVSVSVSDKGRTKKVKE
jgi:hypothetical protein